MLCLLASAYCVVQKLQRVCTSLSMAMTMKNKNGVQDIDISCVFDFYRQRILFLYLKSYMQRQQFLIKIKDASNNLTKQLKSVLVLRSLERERERKQSNSIMINSANISTSNKLHRVLRYLSRLLRPASSSKLFFHRDTQKELAFNNKTFLTE